MRANDDPTGLAVSAGLNNDARVYTQAIKNVNDGISLLSIADGALLELGSVAERQKELAEQAANGTLSLSQRNSLHAEANALVSEFNRITASATFNGSHLFDLSLIGTTVQAGYGATSGIGLQIGSELDRAYGDGTFSAGVSLSAGTSVAIQSADFNEDGRADIVQSIGGSAAFELYAGNGNGSFAAAVTFNGVLNPIASAVYDFNQDGHLDIMFSDTVFLGNGNGTFQVGKTSPIGGTEAIAAADLNGDGILDLAGVNFGTLLSVSFGNGDGTFTAATAYTGGSQSRGVTIGDFNHDGKNDIATSEWGQNAVRVFFNNGDGTFKQSVSYGVGTSPWHIRSIDFNEDGSLDLVNVDANSDTVSVFLGNNDGSFGARTSFSTGPGGPRPFDLEVGDLNGDGIRDIVASNYSGNSIGILIGNNDGSFQPVVTAGTFGAQPRSMATGDFNSDGVMDFVAASNSTATTSVIISNTRQVTTVGRLYLLDQDGALAALVTAAQTLDRVHGEIGLIGSQMSRYEYASSVLSTSALNYIDASSRITDVDVADDTAKYVRSKILTQAGAALLAQGNKQPEIILPLLKTG